MFGLMKNAGCQIPAQPEWYRLHYCGLCKTIGRKYDQKSRLLLNYDAVFLSEVLTLLSHASTHQWDKKIQGYQCFSLPKEADIPVSLDYAADVNMLLAQLKVQDNQTDDVDILWSFIEKIYRKPFKKIQPLLRKWGLEEQVLRTWLVENQRREKFPLPADIQDWQNALHYHAAPTAHITAYFFALGADVIGQASSKEALHEVGFRFGELIYCLDAIKDLPEDRENGQFNALSTFMGAGQTREELLVYTRDFMGSLSAALESSIRQLALEPRIQNALIGRLAMNLSTVLSVQLPTCSMPKTGIEKSTIPRFSRFMRSIFSTFNPAYPGKFSITYLLLLGLFFSEKLLSSVPRVINHTQTGADWTFLSAAVGIPAMAFWVARRISKQGVLARLQKLLDRIKKKIARLKEEDNTNRIFIFLLIILLILLVVLIFAVIKAANDCGDSCGEACSSCGQ